MHKTVKLMRSGSKAMMELNEYLWEIRENISYMQLFLFCLKYLFYFICMLVCLGVLCASMACRRL